MSIYKIGQNQANPNYSVDIMRIDDVSSQPGNVVKTRITPAPNKEIIAGDFKIDGLLGACSLYTGGFADPNTGAENLLNTPHNRNTRYEHALTEFYDRYQNLPNSNYIYNQDGFVSKQVYVFVNRNGALGENPPPGSYQWWLPTYYGLNSFQDPRITWVVLVEVYEDINGNLINNFQQISGSTNLWSTNVFPGSPYGNGIYGQILSQSSSYNSDSTINPTLINNGFPVHIDVFIDYSTDPSGIVYSSGNVFADIFPSNNYTSILDVDEVLYPPVSGCTDFNANNYNPAASYDDGTCLYYGCTNATAGVFPDINGNDSTGSPCTYPCTDDGTLTGAEEGFKFINYDPNSNFDDGTCVLGVAGCTDDNYANYDPLANFDDGTCSGVSQGGCYDLTDGYQTDTDGNCKTGNPLYLGYCADSNGDPTGYLVANFDASATYDDNTCVQCYVYGCTNDNYLEYDPLADCDDGSCLTTLVNGCTDNTSENFNDIADPTTGVVTGTGALNYYAGANNDDGSCIYAFGCADPAYLLYWTQVDVNGNQFGGTTGGFWVDSNSNNRSIDTQSGSCGNTYYVLGCMDNTALNYLDVANGDCFDLHDPANEINGVAPVPDVDCWTTVDPGDGTLPCCPTYDDGNQCTYLIPILGCTDQLSDDYNSLANTEDGSCLNYSGCTDPFAINLNVFNAPSTDLTLYPNQIITANVDDGTCVYRTHGLSFHFITPSGSIGVWKPNNLTLTSPSTITVGSTYSGASNEVVMSAYVIEEPNSWDVANVNWPYFFQSSGWGGFYQDFLNEPNITGSINVYQRPKIAWFMMPGIGWQEYGQIQPTHTNFPSLNSRPDFATIAGLTEGDVDFTGHIDIVVMVDNTEANPGFSGLKYSTIDPNLDYWYSDPAFSVYDDDPLSARYQRFIDVTENSISYKFLEYYTGVELNNVQNIARHSYDSVGTNKPLGDRQVGQSQNSNNFVQNAGGVTNIDFIKLRVYFDNYDTTNAQLSLLFIFNVGIDSLNPLLSDGSDQNIHLGKTAGGVTPSFYWKYVTGCTDQNQPLLYNPDANVDDGSCAGLVFGCVDDGNNSNYPNRPNNASGPADNYNPLLNPDQTISDPNGDQCTYFGCFSFPSNASYSTAQHKKSSLGYYSPGGRNVLIGKGVGYSEADPADKQTINCSYSYRDIACGISSTSGSVRLDATQESLYNAFTNHAACNPPIREPRVDQWQIATAGDNEEGQPGDLSCSAPPTNPNDLWEFSKQHRAIPWARVCNPYVGGGRRYTSLHGPDWANWWAGWGNYTNANGVIVPKGTNYNPSYNRLTQGFSLHTHYLQFDNLDTTKDYVFQIAMQFRGRPLTGGWGNSSNTWGTYNNPLIDVTNSANEYHYGFVMGTGAQNYRANIHSKNMTIGTGNIIKNMGYNFDTNLDTPTLSFNSVPGVDYHSLLEGVVYWEHTSTQQAFSKDANGAKKWSKMTHFKFNFKPAYEDNNVIAITCFQGWRAVINDVNLHCI